MNIKLIWGALLAVLVLTACNDTQNKEAFNTLMDDTMAIHDEAMMQMNTINKLRNSLKESTADSTTVAATITKLEKADKAMMDWMHEFSEALPYEQDRLAGKTDAEIDAAYQTLQEKHAEMKVVQQQMTDAISEAEHLLTP